MLVGDAGGVRGFMPFTRAFLSTCRTHRKSSGRISMDEATSSLLTQAITVEGGLGDHYDATEPAGSVRCHSVFHNCDVTPPSPPPVKNPPSSPWAPCGGRKGGVGGLKWSVRVRMATEVRTSSSL